MIPRTSEAHGTYMEWKAGIWAWPQTTTYATTYIPKTRAEQISQTVKFFPQNCNVPQNTLADVAVAAAHRLIAALQNPAPNALFSENDKATAAALDRLANIFL